MANGSVQMLFGNGNTAEYTEDGACVITNNQVFSSAFRVFCFSFIFKSRSYCLILHY